LKSVLLSSVSHDLRTPLAGIKASVSSLLQRDIQWTDTDRDGFLEDIDAEVDRLTRLVSNLLDLSRIEAGALRPEREWEDVGELIRRVVHRMEPGMRGHSITLDFPADLPAAEVDAVQIEQVLANLLDNAVKYAPPETEVYVEASVVHAPDGLRIGVTDAGKPIPPDQRSKIFDKFYRMKDTSRSTKGTGMGLAIVKGLIEAHGGSVSVEGSDAGNTFVLWLPLGDHHPTVPPVDSSQLSSRPS